MTNVTKDVQDEQELILVRGGVLPTIPLDQFSSGKENFPENFYRHSTLLVLYYILGRR